MAASRSAALAARISPCRASMVLAAASRAAFFLAVPATASARAACRAARPWVSSTVMGFLLLFYCSAPRRAEKRVPTFFPSTMS